MHKNIKTKYIIFFDFLLLFIASFFFLLCAKEIYLSIFVRKRSAIEKANRKKDYVTSYDKKKKSLFGVARISPEGHSPMTKVQGILAKFQEMSC
jgi:hypothetical protein